MSTATDSGSYDIEFFDDKESLISAKHMGGVYRHVVYLAAQKCHEMHCDYFVICKSRTGSAQSFTFKQAIRFFIEG